MLASRMRIAGMPVWALVVLACAIAPFVLRAWVDAEQRRNKRRTVTLLESLGLRTADVGVSRRRRAHEAGSPLAASTQRTSSKTDAPSDDDEGPA
jgi:phage gp36-like protein